MASYKIAFKPSVKKDLRSIPHHDVERILNSIEGLSEHPLPQNARSLTGRDAFRLRVVRCRVNYSIDNEEAVILIIKIGHRGGVYRKFPKRTQFGQLADKAYTREALCVAVRSKMNTNDVLDVLFDLILKRGKPKFIRSDNGPEFIAKHLQTLLRKVGIEPIQIYLGSPWENGYNELFNGTLRNEVLNAEWFYTVHQAQTAINVWLRQYNHIRPHHGLNMRPPVPETLIEKSKNTGTENWS